MASLEFPQMRALKIGFFFMNEEANFGQTYQNSTPEKVVSRKKRKRALFRFQYGPPFFLLVEF